MRSIMKRIIASFIVALVTANASAYSVYNTRQRKSFRLEGLKLNQTISGPTCFQPYITPDSDDVAISDCSAYDAGASGSKISTVYGAYGTTNYFTQTSSTYQPDRISDSHFGGKYYIYANGGQFMDTLSEVVSVGTSWTIYIVMYRTSVSGVADQMPLASQTPATNPYIDITTWSGGTIYCHNGTDDFYSVGGAWSANTDDILVIRGSNGTYSFWNKSGTLSVANGSPPSTMAIGRMFNRYGLDCPMLGGIAAVFFYRDTAHSDSDVAAWITGAKSYYSIP